LFLGKRDLGFLSLVLVVREVREQQERQFAKRDLGFFFLLFFLMIWFGLVVREVREWQERHLQNES
jgi:hypothetical protein